MLVLMLIRNIEYYRKSANEFNRGKNYDDGSKVSTNLGRYETRLYGNLIFFSQDRLSYANMLKKQLCNELNKMGFENFSVQIQQLDDIYVIHKGKIVLHEEMDTILEKYAVLKVSEEQYQAVDKRYLLKEKKEFFGVACLTNEKQYYIENYPEIVVESGSLDQVILMLTGGER